MRVSGTDYPPIPESLGDRMKELRTGVEELEQVVCGSMGRWGADEVQPMLDLSSACTRFLDAWVAGDLFLQSEARRPTHAGDVLADVRRQSTLRALVDVHFDGLRVRGAVDYWVRGKRADGERVSVVIVSRYARVRELLESLEPEAIAADSELRLR